MAEEKNEEKQKHSSGFLQEFRDNLPKSVVPVMLTVLGALAFHSAVNRLNFDVDEKQLTERLEFERSRDISLKQNELMMRDTAGKVVPLADSKLIGEFQDAIPTMSDAKRAKYVERLFAAVNQANGNLGLLEGYTGLESTLPPNWLASQIEFVSADLERMQVALSCAERPLDTTNAKLECLNSLRRQSPRLERAAQRSQTAEKAATAATSMFDADRKHRWDIGNSEVETFFRNGRWALYGLVFSLIGYGVLFQFFILSGQPTRGPEIKESAKAGDDAR